MKTKVEIAFKIIIGVIFIALSVAYLGFDQEWANLPWDLSLIVVSLYNLWTKSRTSNTKEE